MSVTLCVWSPASHADDWPRFRGPNGLGIASSANVPTHWSATQNMVWKTDLPGHGSSSPIVFGDHVYLTCFSGYGLSLESPGNKSQLTRHVLCFDRDSGRMLWKKDFRTDGKEPSYQDYMKTLGYTNSTPVADELGVYVFFGPKGLFAFDHDGKPRWKANVGTNGGVYGGSASSPFLYHDTVIVHADTESGAMIALDKRNGRERWRTPTGKRGDSHSTPIVIATRSRDELVYHEASKETNQTEYATVGAINPRNGQKLWSCNALGGYLHPSPTYANGLVHFVAAFHRCAIRVGVTDTRLAWEQTKGWTSVVSPLYHDGHVYWASHDGPVYCADAQTGELTYENRLRPSPRRIFASPVLAGNHIYYVSQLKGVFVVEASPQFKQIAHNTIEGDSTIFNGTPAIVGNRIYLRSRSALYCIGE